MLCMMSTVKNSTDCPFGSSSSAVYKTPLLSASLFWSWGFVACYHLCAWSFTSDEVWWVHLGAGKPDSYILLVIWQREQSFLDECAVKAVTFFIAGMSPWMGHMAAWMVRPTIGCFAVELKLMPCQNSFISSTSGLRKWFISVVEGSEGPGMMPYKQMFSLL